MVNVVKTWMSDEPVFRALPRKNEDAANDAAVPAPNRSIPDFCDLEHADRTEDIGFFLRLAYEAGDPVLELACGTGRLAIPVARMGSDVTGLDSDPGMLAICEAKRDRLARALKGRLKLVPGDMRDFALDRRFRLVFVAFDAFLTLVTPEDRGRCLAAAHRHLENGGRFAVDVTVPDLGRLTQPDSDEVLERAFYFPNEMQLLLERHGFKVKEVYGSYDMTPLTRESERMILVAEKA